MSNLPLVGACHAYQTERSPAKQPVLNSSAAVAPELLPLIAPDSPLTTVAALYTSFDGQSVGVNDVLVKYTWFGDADLDGRVTSNDYFQIDTGFLANRTGWINGDFDYNGIINSSDYFLIDGAFLAQGGTVLAPDGPL